MAIIRRSGLDATLFNPYLQPFQSNRLSNIWSRRKNCKS